VGLGSGHNSSFEITFWRQLKNIRFGKASSDLTRNSRAYPAGLWVSFQPDLAGAATANGPRTPERNVSLPRVGKMRNISARPTVVSIIREPLHELWQVGARPRRAVDGL
jgi:hypothetical protein